MSWLLSPLLSFLLLYRYLALGLVIFITALALPLPTSSILLATGAFASQSYFNFFLSLIVAVGANVLGDITGYLIARRYGRRILRTFHVDQNASLQSLERYIDRHPGPTIFITRFATIPNLLVNLLAGFSGVPFATFLLYDFLGNLISIGGILYAGYFFGIYWPDFANLVSSAGWIIFGLILVIYLVVLLRHAATRH